MKKEVIISMLIGTPFLAHADGYRYLTLEMADGERVSLTAVGLTVSFTDGNLVASNGTASKTIALNQLSVMSFTTSDETTRTTGISLPESDNLNLNEADAIYDLNGRQIPLGTNLPKGVYIIKKDQQAKKIQIK